MRRLADVGIFYIAQQLLNLRGLVLIPLIARTLGVEAYGTLVLAWNAVMLVQVLTALAFPQGVIRLLSARPEPVFARVTLPTLGLFVLAPWSVLTAGLVLAAGSLGVQLRIVDAAPLALLVAIKALFEAWYFIFSSYWIASSRIRRYVAVQVGFYTGELAAVLAAVLSGQGVLGVLAMSALWEGLYVAGVVGSVLGETGLGRLEYAVLARYLAFCLPAVVPQITLWILGLSDRFILAAFRDTDVVGIYSAAYNLANLIVGYNTAVWFVFAPRASRSYDREGADGARAELASAVRLFLALAIPMAVGLTVLAGPLLDLLLHQNITREARLTVPLVCAGTLAYALYVAASWSFSLRLDNRPLLLFSLAASAVNVLANLLLVPSFGMLGAAVSTTLSYLLLALLGFVFGRRYLPLAIPWTFTWRAALAATAMGAALLLIPIPGHLAWLALAASGAAGLYFALLIVLGGLTAEERGRLRAALTLAGGSIWICRC